jgi:hypothetical protein
VFDVGIITRNPLAFPCGVTPRINWEHPASKGLAPGRGISAIPATCKYDAPGSPAAQTGYWNLLNNKAVQSNFDNQSKIHVHGLIGPAFYANGGNTGCYFSGNAAVADPICTFASFSYYDVAQGNINYITTCTDSSIGGLNFGIAGYPCPYFEDFAHGNYYLGPTFSPNAGYFFLCISSNGARINSVVMDLATGRKWSDSQAQAMSPNASDGTYQVGGGRFHLSTTSTAALMWSPTYLSLPQLLKWSEDPWAFWYPHV